jgi:predicted metal-dependent hydrolase
MNDLKSVLYKGQEYEVRLLSYAGKKSQIIFRDCCFTIYVNSSLSAERKRQEAVLQLRQWMCKEAETLLGKRAEEYAKIIGVSYKNIRIKDIKSRWGSCSSKGNLNFNFRLVMSPPEVMDYVVVHELCHLRHMNHSKDFWKLVEEHMPEYVKHKNWLKENGIRLFKI